AKSFDVRGYDGRRARHRLRDRKPKSLGERGINERLGRAIEVERGRPVRVTRHVDLVAERGSRDAPVEGEGLPARSPREHEVGPRAAARPEALARGDQRLDVLPRFERPEVEDVMA